jgi:hypothetical protein
LKEFLRHRSRRWGYDGWALLIPGATKAMDWTVCTTRAECRELRAERGDLLDRGAEIVKVRISVEVVE